MRTYKIRVSDPHFAYEFVHDDGSVETLSPLRDDGSVDVVNVDQFSSQPFMLNQHGFVSNDIMVFEQSQSDSVARAALARLKTINSGSLPADLDVDTALRMVVPSNYGSPAEYFRLQRSFAENVYNMRKIAADKQLEDSKKIDFTENVNDVDS